MWEGSEGAWKRGWIGRGSEQEEMNEKRGGEEKWRDNPNEKRGLKAKNARGELWAVSEMLGKSEDGRRGV